jgi:hypothetical protein
MKIKLKGNLPDELTDRGLKRGDVVFGAWQIEGAKKGLLQFHTEFDEEIEVVTVAPANYDFMP